MYSFQPPAPGIDSSCSRSGNGAVRLSHLRRNPSDDFDRTGTVCRVFLNRQRGDPPFRQSQRRRFVTKADIDQREVSNEIIIFRLLL